MARLTLDLPERFLYKAELPVRASDINYGGHVGNDSVLTLMQEARIQFYNYLGYKSELHFEGSVGQIVTDALVIYKSESFLGDKLKIEISAQDFNKYGFDLIYLITNLNTGNETARGKTGIVCFDYESKKVVSVPSSLLAKLKSSQ